LDKTGDLIKYRIIFYFAGDPNFRQERGGIIRGRKDCNRFPVKSLFFRSRSLSTAVPREETRREKKSEGKEAKNPSAEDFQLRRLKFSRDPLVAAALLSSVA